MSGVRMNPSCLTCNIGNENYSNLTHSELEAIDSNKSSVVFKKGELLCKQGNYVSSIAYIRSGLAKEFVENGSHSTFILLKTQGTFVGLSSLFSNNIHHYSAVALSQAEVCLINFDVFSSIVQNNSKFAADIISRLNKDRVSSYKRFVSLTQKHLHGRVAELLLYLSEEVYQSNPFLFAIPKNEFAKLVSASKESLSRVFSSFKKDAIIEEFDQYINILDKDRLARISNVG